VLLVTPGEVKGLATGGLVSVQKMVDGNHIGSEEEKISHAFLRLI
jgi:hypothetical protein